MISPRVVLLQIMIFQTRLVGIGTADHEETIGADFFARVKKDTSVEKYRNAMRERRRQHRTEGRGGLGPLFRLQLRREGAGGRHEVVLQVVMTLRRRRVYGKRRLELGWTVVEGPGESEKRLEEPACQ